jgi:hypothetical protein
MFWQSKVIHESHTNPYTDKVSKLCVRIDIHLDNPIVDGSANIFLSRA